MAAELKAAIRETGVAPYADAPHAGVVRYVQGVVQRSDERVQVVVVGNEAEPHATGPLLDCLARRLGMRLQGLFFNGQPERSNAIIGPHWRHWAGETSTRERIGGADVFFPPGAFGQANLAQADRLVERVHEWVPSAAHVLECYAGTGAIGLGCAGRAGSLVLNERSPHGLDGLARGVDALPPDARARVRVIEGPAEMAAPELRGSSPPDVVIVDPPRKGICRELRAALVADAPARLVYVSCDVDSFLDDARVLLTSSALRLGALEAWAFFPFTEHVEVLARFDRV
jgi:23S rRNA (uracil1939-C5)-methyltransferase